MESEPLLIGWRRDRLARDGEAHHRIISEIRLSNIHPADLRDHRVFAFQNEAVLAFWNLNAIFAQRFVGTVTSYTATRDGAQFNRPRFLVGEINVENRVHRLAAGVQDNE